MLCSDKKTRSIRKSTGNVLLSSKDVERYQLVLCVMDKHQYSEKALSLLNDGNTYSFLKSDPTSKTQRKLNNMLLDLKKAGIINEDLYRMLYSSDGLSPRFYGLPKIHKTGIPLRPIVSFINSPTYDVSSYLAKILSPVVGNTGNTVKNSLEFENFIRGKTRGRRGVGIFRRRFYLYQNTN